MFSDEVLLVTDFVNHHHQHFLVNIDSGDLVRHDLLPAWKGRTCGIEVKLSHALLPFPLGRAATHLWVQNARSGPYSVTVSTHPERRRPPPLHVGDMVHLPASPIFIQLGGPRAHGYSVESRAQLVCFQWGHWARLSCILVSRRPM